MMLLRYKFFPLLIISTSSILTRIRKSSFLTVMVNDILGISRCSHISKTSNFPLWCGRNFYTTPIVKLFNVSFAFPVQRTVFEKSWHQIFEFVYSWYGFCIKRSANIFGSLDMITNFFFLIFNPINFPCYSIIFNRCCRSNMV